MDAQIFRCLTRCHNLSHLDFGFRNSEFEIFIHFLFLLAGLIDETVIANNSSASFVRVFTVSICTIPPSIRSSIQYIVSSVSSSTTPILAIKSAVDLALQEAR